MGTKVTIQCDQHRYGHQSYLMKCCEGRRRADKDGVGLCTWWEKVLLGLGKAILGHESLGLFVEVRWQLRVLAAPGKFALCPRLPPEHGTT